MNPGETFLPDVTMFVPTFNRPRLLAGLLHFYGHVPTKFRIVVADGSVPEIQAKNRETAAAYPRSVEHRMYPGSVGAYDRFIDAVSSIRSEYVCFCGDDDVLLPDGMAAALEFLRQHPDYVAAHGINYWIGRNAENGLYARIKDIPTSIDMAGPVARLLAVGARYQAPTYAVQRTSTFLDGLAPKTLDSGHFWELYSTFTIAFQGKIKALACPYYVINPQRGDRPENFGEPNNHIAVDLAGYFIRDLANFRQHIVPHLRRFAAADVDVERLVDAAFALYIARTLNAPRIAMRLGQSGFITEGEEAMLNARMGETNEGAIPGEYLTTTLREFFEAGWPFEEQDAIVRV